jgi:hypothetical protein
MVSASGIFNHIVGAIFRDRPSRVLWLTAAVLNAVGWGATRWSQSGESFVPLHYTIYFGIDLTGPPSKLYLLPAAGTVMLVLHTLGAATIGDHVWKRSFLLILVGLETLLALALATVLTLAEIRV